MCQKRPFVQHYTWDMLWMRLSDDSLVRVDELVELRYDLTYAPERALIHADLFGVLKHRDGAVHLANIHLSPTIYRSGTPAGAKKEADRALAELADLLASSGPNNGALLIELAPVEHEERPLFEAPPQFWHTVPLF